MKLKTKKIKMVYLEIAKIYSIEILIEFGVMEQNRFFQYECLWHKTGWFPLKTWSCNFSSTLS